MQIVMVDVIVFYIQDVCLVGLYSVCYLNAMRLLETWLVRNEQQLKET